VTGLPVGHLLVQTPAGTRDFSVPLGVLTNCGAHPTVYSVDTVGKGAGTRIANCNFLNTSDVWHTLCTAWRTRYQVLERMMMMVMMTLVFMSSVGEFKGLVSSK